MRKQRNCKKANPTDHCMHESVIVIIVRLTGFLVCDFSCGTKSLPILLVPPVAAIALYKASGTHFRVIKPLSGVFAVFYVSSKKRFK